MKRGYKNSHADLTAAFVRDVFDYNPDTGDLFWKRQLSRRAPIGQRAGVTTELGRIKVGIRGKDYMAHRIIWLWMTGKWPEFEVDHRDLNQGNNRWTNLRHATSEQNQRNRGCQKNNKTGYVGVTYVPKRKRYIAGIKVKGYRHNLGSFLTAEEAHAAYVAAAKRLHKTFARVR